MKGLLAGLFVVVLILTALIPLNQGLQEPKSAFVCPNPHAPISINGNAQFTPANGVTGGSGTQSNPYIISGWNISATLSTGLQIRNTDAPFIIRKVCVHSGGFYVGGIFLDNVKNGRVEDSMVWENGEGILVGSSERIAILNNTAFSNDNRGIFVYGTQDSSISSNRVSLNRLSLNDYLGGICLMTDNNVSVSANRIFSNLNEGVADYFSTMVSISANDIFSNVWAGVELYGSMKPLVTANNISHNDVGIDIHDATGASITANSISFNGAGFWLDSDRGDSSISSNRIWSNGRGLALSMSGSARTSISSNEISSNLDGIWGYYAINTFVIANNVSSNGDGIDLYGATNVSIISNDVLSNKVGIALSLSTSVTVYHNNITDNTYKQATDDARASNSWDDGYPSGGNYWSDYTGLDWYSGPGQNIPGPDGIGDTPYVIDSDSQDRYPLMGGSYSNYPPIANAGGPYTGYEGSVLTLDASASSDPNGDALQFRWDFDNDGLADTSWSSFPTVNHTWSDDYVGVLRVEVSDGKSTGNATAPVKAINIPPSIRPFGPFTVVEGSSLSIAAGATDPGSDDLTFTWTFEYGPTVQHAHYNDGTRPDPYPSPWGTYPFSANDTASITYGDNGIYRVSLKVIDDDGGTATCETNVTVLNVLPSGTVTITSAQHEGGPIAFSAHVTDAGSDDILLTWKWGFGAPDEKSTYYSNGVSPDPYPSPDIQPRDIIDVKTHAYGDNGAFIVTVFVQDDDSGSSGTTLTITATPDNLPPSVSVSGGMNINEGQSVSLTVTATDPGSDDLNFDWSWGEGSSDSKIYYNDGVGPDPSNSPGGTYPFTAIDARTHPYGDNGLYTVTLTVTDDDGGSTTWSGQVAVANLPPTVSAFGPFAGDEGSLLSLTANASDPGSDDLTFSWTFELGPTFDNIHYNDGVSPDPSQSPGGTYPFAASDSAEHTYGDNGVYVVTLTVTDDDGGSASYSTQVSVNNLPPSIAPLGPFTVDEGSPLSINATATDPGSDDLTFTWAFELGPTMVNIHFNDGVSPDPPQSPDGAYPFTASDSVEHTYGDNGVYVLVLTVTDDDDGSASYSTEVNVTNLPPSITPFGPFDVNEADPLTVATGATDPGSDDLTFTWTFEYGPTMQDVYYNDGIGLDPPNSPDGIFPFNATDMASYTYGDNGVFKISLTVQDDDGGVATYETYVTVHNVAPVIGDVQAYVIANLTLRVAGEKWHDVCMNLVHNGGVEGRACVTRYPGSPDEQSATITGKIQLLGDFRIVLYYTPDDDPANGQPNGANPAWVTLSFPNGVEVTLHHTFNVQHNDTWVWTIDDFRAYLVGQRITFDASASDVGSDDLTFEWEWGDGTPATTTTYFNDGIGPDPYPSPGGVFPFTATDVQTHAYSVAGTYSIALNVSDDDGGVKQVMFAIVIG